MDIPLDEVLHFDAITSDSTGAATDADSTPTFSVFEEATDTPILADQNFTKRTSLTGNYRGTVTLSAANGFEAGKWYNVIGSATVDTVAGKARVLDPFRVVPAETQAGVPKVDLAYSLGVAITNSDFTIASATASTVTLPTTYTNGNSLPDDDRYTFSELHVISGTGAGQCVLLTTAAAGAREYNVVSASMPVQLDNTSTCIVRGSWTANLTHVVGVTTDVSALATNVAAILADTNELQTDWANGGRLDLILDATATASALASLVTTVGAAGAGLTAADDAVIAAIAALNNLSSAQAQTAAAAALTAYDPPTNAEMEARTLLAASYFDPAADTVANVTTVGSVTTKTGYALAATGLDSITTTDPGAVASTFPQMLVQLWRRFFKKSTLTATELKTYADNGTTVVTTQTVSDDGTTQTQGVSS